MGSFEKTIELFDAAAGDPRKQRALLAVAAEFADDDSVRLFEVSTRVTGLKELYGATFFDEEMNAQTVMELVGDSLDEIKAAAV